MDHIQHDPFALLLRADDLSWPPDVDPVADALRSFDPADPSKLVLLLQSEHRIVQRRGLLLFGELGAKAAGVLDIALRHVDHPDPQARSSLMNGVIAQTKKLNVAQTSRVLTLANDPEDMVREKVIAFVGGLDLAALTSAIALMTETARVEHLASVDEFFKHARDTQAIFDEAIASSGTRSTYAYAAIQARARRGDLLRSPEYKGGDFLPTSVLTNVRRLMHRRNEAT